MARQNWTFRCISAFLFKFPFLIKDDKNYLKWRYYHAFGHWFNFENPKTFCQKLNWLKLYNRNAEYTNLVDKYEVKKFVAAVVGEDYIIPTLGVWNSFEEIDFQSLPDKFVLKTTHDSGGVVICQDKKTLNYSKSKKMLEYSLKRNFYLINREWPYKNVKPRIIAEKYIGREEGLRDYKFFCFNGVPKMVQVISDRNNKEHIDFYDMSWERIEGLIGLNMEISPCNSDGVIDCPASFSKMKEIACKLSNGYPFLRIDLYDIDGKCYFGEITFYPAGGFGRFFPDEWNKIIGDWIVLPSTNPIG